MAFCIRSVERVRAALSGLAAVILAAAAAPSAAAASSPVIDPVFNDTSCVPSPAHPKPVVYLHGTGSSSEGFVGTARFLRERGFCLWTLHYGSDRTTLRGLIPGQDGVGPVEDSLEEVAVFVDDVLAATGSAQVDLVGYSLGGTLTKAYIEGRGQAAKVGRAVSLGATFRGTNLSGLTYATASALGANPGSSELLLGASTLEQRQDSDVIAWLSGLPDTTPGVVYTNLYTPSDTVATPNSTSMLESSGGADVANVDIEETCGETISHFDLPGAPASAHLIYWGLNRGPGDVVPSVEDCGV